MEDSGSRYEDWFNSPYHHLLYASGQNDNSSSFIARLITSLNPPSSSYMLDAACGKGVAARVLAAKGFDVTGLDLSFGNIHEALAYEADNLHFYQHDLRLPFRTQYFHYAFHLFTGFGYYPTQREHHNAIRTIAGSLKPGGTLVMDCLNPAYEADHLLPVSEKTIGDTRFHITQWLDENHFHQKIIIEDNHTDGPITYTEKRSRFSLEQFTQMFIHQGLHIQEVFGDYELNGYDPLLSPRIIITARK